MGPLGLLLLLAAPRPAGAAGGLTALPFLQRPLDARSAGTAGAAAAVPGRLGSIEINPASIARLQAPALAMTYLSGPALGNLGLVAYGRPLAGLGALAAGVEYFNAGPIDLNLSDGTRGRVAAEEDLLGIVSFAKELLPGLGLGASYKYARSSLAGGAARASSSLWDIGALWSPGRGFSAGWSLQNLGPDVRFESEGDPPPRTARYGIGYRFPSFEPRRADPDVDISSADLLLAADIVETLHEERSPRLGMELGMVPPFLNRFALRTGWSFNRSAESFAFGFGAQEGRYGLDYALAASRTLESVHQLTLTVEF